MYTYNKLRGRIVEKFGSAKQFHMNNKDKICCSYPTVTNKLNGVCRFTQEEILVWAECLDIPQDELYEYFFN